MIQQPRVPSLGLLPASDVLIRAKEMIINKDTLVELLAKHTGNSLWMLANVMRRPLPSKNQQFTYAEALNVIGNCQDVKGERGLGPHTPCVFHGSVVKDVTKIMYCRFF